MRTTCVRHFLLPQCFVPFGVVAAISFFCICVGCFVQYLPAILGSGDGILSKNRTKVAVGASSDSSLVLCCARSLCFGCMQLIQQLWYHLLETMRVWKLGVPAMVTTLAAHCNSLYTCFVLVSELLGHSGIWPKLHELRHIPQDLVWISAADNSDTGAWCHCCAYTRAMRKHSLLTLCGALRRHWGAVAYYHEETS